MYWNGLQARSSEIHRLLLRYSRAVTNYRRNFICGGSFFLTANLAERRLHLPVGCIVSAKDDGFRCRSTILRAMARPSLDHEENAETGKSQAMTNLPIFI
jgi:hypothetical protein